MTEHVVTGTVADDTDVTNARKQMQDLVERGILKDIGVEEQGDK